MATPDWAKTNEILHKTGLTEKVQGKMVPVQNQEGENALGPHKPVGGNMVTIQGSPNTPGGEGFTITPSNQGPMTSV